MKKSLFTYAAAVFIAGGIAMSSFGNDVYAKAFYWCRGPVESSNLGVVEKFLDILVTDIQFEGTFGRVRIESYLVKRDIIAAAHAVKRIAIFLLDKCINSIEEVATVVRKVSKFAGLTNSFFCNSRIRTVGEIAEQTLGFGRAIAGCKVATPAI